MLQPYLRIDVTNMKREIDNLPRGLQTNQRTRRLNSSDIVPFLSNPDTQWKLFPHGFVIINSVPYKVMPGNFPLIKKNSTAVFASYMDTPRGLEVTSASFAECYQISIGLVYHMDYYGQCYNDLCCHLENHLTVARDYHTSKALFINVYFPAVMDVEEVHKRLTNYEGLKFVDKDIMSKACHFARFPIPKHVAASQSKL